MKHLEALNYYTSEGRIERLGFILVFLLLLFVNPCCAQAGFNKTYELGRSIWFKDIVYDENMGIIISSVYYNDSSNLQNVLLIYSDTSGAIYKTINIADPVNESSLSIANESTFLINSYSNSVIPFSFYNKSSIGLAFVDSEKEVVTIREYEFGPGGNVIPTDIIENKGGYLVSGAYQRPPLLSVNAFLLSVDSHGNKNWLYDYGSDSYEEYARSITFIDSNFYLLSGTKWIYGEDFLVGWAGAIDSLGKLKWQWAAEANEITSKGIMSLELDTINNQLKYFTFFERPTSFPDEDFDVSIPLFVCRDTSMNLVSYKECGEYAIGNYIRDLIESREGWIGIGGITTTTDDYISPDVTDMGQVLKLSNEGELLWQVVDSAFYSPILGSRSYLRGAAESPSGSIYAVGSANNYDEDEIYRGYGWLLKISPDGCVDTLCTTTSIEEQMLSSKSGFKIYPNPATDFIYLDNPYPPLSTYYFELYNCIGKRCIRSLICERNQFIPLEGVGTGMHFWKVTDSRGLIVDQGKLILVSN